MADQAPQHWLEFTDSTNWFRLWFPPQWEVEERPGSVAFRPPDSDGLLALNVIWVEGRDPSKLPGLADIVKQFPKSRNVVAVEASGIEGVSECLKGEAILDQSTGWLGTILGRAEWRHWTMWCFREGPLVIVATQFHEAERDPEFESMGRMILRCMQLNQEPADPPDVFAQRVLELARKKFPLLESELLEDFQLQLDSSRINLANFYRNYVRNPDAFEQMVLPALTTAVQVQGWGDTETNPPLEAVRDRLMPMFYPNEAWKEKFPDIVGEPWVGGLAVLYVVDEANAYWYVRQDLLDSWELSAEELHDIALDNLQRYFQEEPMEMTVAAAEDGQGSIMMPSQPNSYNSVRLLSHEFLDKLRGVAGGDLAVGVPGRDYFVAVSMKLPEVVGQIRSRVANEFQHTDHPLTDRMLLITPDGVSELVDDSGGT